MTTNTLKEQFLDLFNENTNSDIVWDFIETQIALARKEGAEEMKKKLIAELPIALRKHSHVWTIGSIQETIVNSISSL